MVETQDVAPAQSDAKELKEMKVSLQIAEGKLKHLEQDYKKLMLENMNLQEENDKLKKAEAKVSDSRSAPRTHTPRQGSEETKSNHNQDKIIQDLELKIENLKQEKSILQKELGVRKLEMPFKIDVSQVSRQQVFDPYRAAAPVAE